MFQATWELCCGAMAKSSKSALAERVDALVQSVDDDLVDRQTCLQFLEKIGVEPHDIRRVLELYGHPGMEQISLKKLLAFILDPAWLLPLPPGLYEKEDNFLGDGLIVVTRKGNAYVFDNRAGFSICAGLEGLCLSDFKVRDEPFCIEHYRLREGDIAKLLPAEEWEKARKPRPFSPCLVGHYGGGDGGRFFDRSGGYANFYGGEYTIDKDGSVRYVSKYRIEYDKNGEEVFNSKDAEKTSPVKSVSRGVEWSITLHPGADAFVEVHIPPLCLVELENGHEFDLSNFSFSAGCALISSTQISYHGHLKEEEGAECIVSFPGRYPDGWLECVQGSHDMGVACVFLCGKEDGLGEHAIDPDDGANCYCHKIYGVCGLHRKFRTKGFYGHKDQRECEKNGGRPSWGCKWFQRWRDNVEVAVQRKQKLVVYFFAGEVGEGLVKWENLSTAELWDGKGLGGSQKGEVAYLQKMNYDFEMKDVGPFLKEFAKTTIRID